MSEILGPYARMWPRAVFYRNAESKGTKKTPPKKGKLRISKKLFRTLELLKQPGVYILYRDDVPYYIGQAKRLRGRLWRHACVPGARYFNHWNFFSAFVVESEAHRDEIESILIAAMPTANSTKPLKAEPLPPAIIRMVREIQVEKANPRIAA